MTDQTIVTPQSTNPGVDVEKAPVTPTAPLEAANQVLSNKLFDNKSDTPMPDKDAAKVESKPEDKAPENKTENKSNDKPKEFNLKLPEDSELSDSAVERIAEYAKKQGLTEDQAQNLLNLESESLKEYEASQRNRLQEMRAEWVNTVKADKEIGGEHFNQSVEMARRSLEKFATPEFIKGLNETGFGDHPEVVRVFARIGKLISSDKLVTSNQPSGKKLEDLFYKTSKE